MTYGTHLSSSSLLLSTNNIRWSCRMGPPLGGQAPSEERPSRVQLPDRAAAVVHRRREREPLSRHWEERGAGGAPWSRRSLPHLGASRGGGSAPMRHREEQCWRRGELEECHRGAGRRAGEGWSAAVERCGGVACVRVRERERSAGGNR